MRGSCLRAMYFEVEGKKPISSYLYGDVQILWKESKWRRLSSFLQRYQVITRWVHFKRGKKKPEYFDAGLCSHIPASCSELVSPRTTRKCIGCTDTSKSFLIPHFRSLEINFIINLEAWFNCTNYIFSWELMDYYLPSSCCM